MFETPPQDDPKRSPSFPLTQWTWIRQARGDEPEAAANAMAVLCQSYWYPVYSFVRRTGKSPHDAEDFTQGFFAKMIENDTLAHADQERGKFRSFLLTTLKHFLSDEYRKAQTTKRGGDTRHLSIDQELAEKRFQLEPSDTDTPETAFERQWAATLLETVHNRQRKDYQDRGKEPVYEALRRYLPWNEASTPQRTVADQLNMKLSTLRAEVFHMRRRYAEILRDEIGQTVETESDIDDEIRYLRRLFTL